uniref:Uncharacterized protein n=1 Tax=Physcomitrium patens TaxID=3218 RepID=A0A7I4FJV9_PHYPA|nr:uncharacterized protein LOC112279062 isoform X7 [Physcomitrium patens]|eukprot:XP_024368912.1 uncharacterized protein LOC112279062 isoform X7 [Physcomitrella patens]
MFRIVSKFASGGGSTEITWTRRTVFLQADMKRKATASPRWSFEGQQFSLNRTKSKLAFMFLTGHNMALDILWNQFFEEVEEHEYSVYIHARPGYSFSKGNTICRSFINRQLNNSILVEWGEATMIRAERLLLTEALQDPLNQRFFLLSDSCIPLYNFTHIYNYVMSSQKSFVDSFVDKNDDQYNILMEPVISEDKWRKGSQWVALTRKHAEVIAGDSTVFPSFVDHCKKINLSDNWKGDPMNNETIGRHNCIPDEHYIQTLLAIKGLEGEIERRTLTFSRWENSAKDQGQNGWHPVTFKFADATVQTIKEIQAITNVRYEIESRTEWCSAGGHRRHCFLFARKFTRAAAFRLIDQVDQYKSSDPDLAE